MELIEFDNLPKDVKGRFKKEFDKKFDDLFKAMGIEPTIMARADQWKWTLKDTFFIKEPGNVYLSFEPKVI